MIRGVMPKIDPTTAPEGSGSRYPAPFDASCKKRSWRRLGEAAGLTQFGVNLGHCESDTVETTKLPTFEPGLVFGGGGADGGGGKCFDTLGCFPNADSAELDMSDCTVPMPETASASKINVAFVPGSGTGICRPDEKTKCFVPVDCHRIHRLRVEDIAGPDVRSVVCRRDHGEWKRGRRAARRDGGRGRGGRRIARAGRLGTYRIGLVNF